MNKEKEIEFLKWCKLQEIDQVVDNSRSNYLKNQPNALAAFLETQVNTSSSRAIADSCNNLAELKLAVENFEGCGLKNTATKTVFADGNPNSDVMVIGEAPGMNEDIQGIPFCGESGQLLDKVLASISLSRKVNIYITNSIFWRPPGNRKPTDEEISICLPFVEKHIALLSPKLLIVVGSVALQALFGNLGSISKQRQKKLEYTNKYLKKSITAVVTFHPSYLLRQPSQKKMAWQDMLFVKRLMV